MMSELVRVLRLLRSARLAQFAGFGELKTMKYLRINWQLTAMHQTASLLIHPENHLNRKIIANFDCI